MLRFIQELPYDGISTHGSNLLVYNRCNRGTGREDKGKRWKRQSFVTAGKIWRIEEEGEGKEMLETNAAAIRRQRNSRQEKER